MRNNPLLGLSLNYFTGTFGFAVSFPFLAVYCHKELGVPVTETGIAFGAVALARAVFQVAGGELADRFSLRVLMVSSIVIRSVSFALVGLGVHARIGFYPIIGLVLCTAVTGAVQQTSSQTAIAAVMPPERRMHGYAVSRSAGNLGFAAGPAVGGWLVSFSYVWPFAVTAVFLLLSALPLLWLHPHREKSTAPSSDPPVPMRPVVFAYMLGLFLLGCVMSEIITPVSLYLVGLRGLSESRLGWLYALNGALVVSLQVVVMRWISGAGYLRILAFGSMGYYFAYVFLGSGDGFAWYAVSMVFITVAEVLVAPPMLALAERLAPEGRSGRYLGMAGVAISLGWSAGPAYASYALENLNPPVVAWAVAAAPAVLAALLFLALQSVIPEGRAPVRK